MNFFNNERGITSIEYAFITGLIALTIIASAGSLGAGVSNAFSNISTILKTASGNTNSVNSSNNGNNNGNINNGNNNNNNSNGNNNSNNNGKNNSNGNN